MESLKNVVNADGRRGIGIISSPGENDVLFGRGGAINSHRGNILFRKIVNDQKEAYFEASKVNKPKIAIRVVEIIRNLTPPGRFLAPLNEDHKNYTKKDCILWQDVGSKKARAKASQCLRERERYENKLRKPPKQMSRNSVVHPSQELSSASSFEDQNYLGIPDNFLVRGNMSIDLAMRTERRKKLKPIPVVYKSDELNYNVPKESNLSTFLGASNAWIHDKEPPKQMCSDSSWLGSFYSLESHLIDTSMSFSSPEASLREPFLPIEKESPSYNHQSSSSTVSDITYQSEYECK